MNVTWLNKERFVFLLSFLFLVSSGVGAMKDRPQAPAVGEPKVDIGDRYKHDRPEAILNRRLVDDYVAGAGNRNPFTGAARIGDGAKGGPRPAEQNDGGGKGSVGDGPPSPPGDPNPADPKKPPEDPVPFAFLGFKRLEADGVTYVWLLDKRTQAGHDVFKGHAIPNSDLKLVEVTLQSVIVQNKKGQRYRWKSNDQKWEPVR